MKKLTIVDAIIVLAITCFFMFLLTVSACKTKDRQKDKFSQKLEIESVKSTLTTTVIDTVLSLPGTVVSASEPLNSIVNGDTLTATKNGTSVKAWYNPATKNLHIIGETEAQTIPIQATVTKATNEKTKGKSVTKQLSKATETKTDVWGTVQVVFWIVIAILAIYFAFRLYLFFTGAVPRIPGKWP
jgi:hypothetical protein